MQRQRLKGIAETPMFQVTVRLDQVSSNDLTITWEAKADASATAATADTDFVAVSDGTATINAGEMTGTFNVQLIGDTDGTEDNETFIVNIKSVTPSSNTVLSSSREATVTIREDDRPILTIANMSDEITEGENAEFTVTSTMNPSGGTLSFNYIPISENFLATGVSETVVASPSLAFSAAGSVYTTTLSVTTEDDSDVIEENGLLTVTIDEGTGYTVGDTATASVHVSDNDATAPSLTIVGPSTPVTEGFGAGIAEFTIVASVDPERTMDVRYRASESGGDFLSIRC